MTFKDLYDEFSMHNDEIMKATTLCGYSYKEKYIECFFPVKIKDFAEQVIRFSGYEPYKDVDIKFPISS